MRFHDIGLENDEGAPFGDRWNGYRFQITIFYIPLVSPVDTWEDAKFDGAPPVEVKSALGDIRHAPTKDGKGLVNIIGKQLWSLPLLAR